MPRAVLKFPKPHPGQARILREAAGAGARYVCVRCGRRFGKTTLAVILALRVLLPLKGSRPPGALPGRVGYFAPNQDKFLEFWEEMIRRLGPTIASKNKNEKRITLYNGAVLDCWTLDTDDPARSRMYDLAIIDEAGLLRNLSMHWRRAIRPTLLDRSGSAWFLGSPKPVGRDFDVLFKMGLAGRPGWASFSGKTLDNPKLPDQARADVLAAREEMPEEEWLEEYEGIPRGSASEFFREEVITEHIDLYACPPLRRGALYIPLQHEAERDAILSEGMLGHLRWREDKKGAWRLWFNLDRGGRPDPILGPQGCMGVDIGCGVRASNSVIAVGNSDTGEKIAEYASAGDSPEELARVAVGFALWVGGGKGPARVHFDATGATGEQFVKVLHQLNFGNIHVGRASPRQVRGRSPLKYGLQLNETTKVALLSGYRSALQTEAMINRSEKSLRECLQFHVDEYGKVVHLRDVGGDGDAETGAQTPHGDYPIADALLWQCMENNPKGEPKEATPPVGSYRWQQLQDELERAAFEEEEIDAHAA